MNEVVLIFYRVDKGKKKSILYPSCNLADEDLWEIVLVLTNLRILIMALSFLIGYLTNLIYWDKEDFNIEDPLKILKVDRKKIGDMSNFSIVVKETRFH